MRDQTATISGVDGEATAVLQRVWQSKQTTQDLRYQWYDSIAFVRGDQWSYWDRGSRRVRQHPAMPWRIRVTDNQILPLIQMQLALLIERQPAFTALARTDDEEDVQAALGIEGLFRYQWDRCDATDKLADALRTSLVTGNGFWRVVWNAHAGVPELVSMPPGMDLAGTKEAPKAGDTDNLQMVPPEMLPEGYEQDVYPGDVGINVVSPFSMHVDPVATSIRDARWMAQEVYVHIDTLKDLFGGKVRDQIVPDVEPTEFYNFELSLRFDQGWALGASDDVKEQVKVTEFWEGPSRKHRFGRVLTVANGRTLDVKENPYDGRFPFVHFPCLKVEGRFWADGFVKHQRPLQTMHNRALSRYHEIMNLAGNPKYVADKLAGLKETNINDRPGEVITINPGGQLQALPAPPAPTIHPQIMSMAMNSLQTISGVNDPLAGNNPPNVRSGRTIAFLQEAGMRRFVPLALQVESGLRDAGRIMLAMIKRCYSEDRVIRILGPNAEAQVIAIRQSDLSRVEDVTVAHGSMIPTSKAAKQDMVLDLLTSAPMLFSRDDGSVNKEYIFRSLDMPSVNAKMDPDECDRKLANRENAAAMEGRPIMVEPFHNHVLHSSVHRRQLVDVRCMADPTAYETLKQHWMQHQAMMGMGMAPPGMPMPGGGGPAGLAPPNQGLPNQPGLPGGEDEATGEFALPGEPRGDMAGGSE